MSRLKFKMERVKESSEEIGGCDLSDLAARKCAPDYYYWKLEISLGHIFI
jgi:hypothetical protein